MFDKNLCVKTNMIYDTEPEGGNFVLPFTLYNAADVIPNFKNVTILEFHDHIWNHCASYIQLSTNMPGIGSFGSKIG